MGRLLIIDANNLAFRCYHSTALATSYGKLVNIIYGTINSLLFYNHRLKPDAVVFVWDTKSGSTWRKAMYPGYKEHRKQTASSPDFSEQVEKLKSILPMLGVATIDATETEADDVIGYLAQKYAEENEVVVVSSDGDFYQLMANPNIKRFHPTNEFIKPEDDAKFGVTADKIVGFKALVGDTADEFSGISKFGPKTAAKFFAANSGDVEDIWTSRADFSMLSAAMAAKILTSKAEVMLCRDLATINIERGRVGEIAWPCPDLASFSDVCEELEFNSYLRRWVEFGSLPAGGL